MNPAAAREAARRFRAELGFAEDLTPAADVVSRALEVTNITAHAVPKEDPLLSGAIAVLDRDFQAIWYDDTQSTESVRFSVSHEMAHWRIHESHGPCGDTEIDTQPQDSPAPFGESYIRGYSPAQRRETEANIFAAELLAPGAAVSRAFQDGSTASEISTQLGVAESTVRSKLLESVLIPLLETPIPLLETPTCQSSLDLLDSSQRAAATLESGPALVVAGPGTGKTRTLIGRIEVLMQRGARPDQILALTFSNRAADEMRERLFTSVAGSAHRVWIGTFHAFGLDVLRRFGSQAGIAENPRLLDPMDAIALAERHLAELELVEYEYLHDPALPMRDLLSAVSRAKDEVKSPEDYAALARKMSESADDEKSTQESKKALETARFYAKWEEILQQEGMIDFGDLLYRTVRLLREVPAVRDQLRSEFPHIVVDEYQDINRASALLIKELAGDGRGLWVVGDLRQAIYGFRGASPANVMAFERDYPLGVRVSLDVNYRSSQRLVELFESTADAIRQPVHGDWAAHRGPIPSHVTLADAEDEEAQADGIARCARQFEVAGIPLQEQVILCRTNRQAEALNRRLEARGLPVVYVGSPFSYEQVKNLLALLSLACEGPHALSRVAAIPEYSLSSEETERISKRADEVGVIPALSESVESGARKLFEHIAALAFAGDAYAFLSRYLFGPAAFLRNQVREPSIPQRQELLAIHQIMLLARQFEVPPGEEAHPQRAFLSHVRRLMASREDARMAVPATSLPIDGLRLMTAHSAKGLEFPVVYIPNLCAGMFPSRAIGGMVKLPPGLIECNASEPEEEERLFFVAISRARDHLLLSHPARSGGQAMKPSPLLDLVRDPLSSGLITSEHWSTERGCEKPDTAGSAQAGLARPAAAPLHEAETYLRCPRQYYYRYCERLSEPEHTAPYRAFAEAARKLTRWAQQERRQYSEVRVSALRTRLDDLWDQSGIGDHPHAPVLRSRLEAIGEGLRGIGSEAAKEWTVTLDDGILSFRPDGIWMDGDMMVIERHHLGPQRDTHRKAPVLSLYRLAAAQRGAAKVRIENLYLATGEASDVPESPRYEPARVQKYSRALRGMAECRFDPEPAEANECNRCPFFLVCPR